MTNNLKCLEKPKHSSNTTFSENPKPPNNNNKKTKRISQQKINHNFSLNENNYNNKKNINDKEPKILKKICARTKTGKYSDGKEKANNQDSFLIKSKILGNENFSLVGVFDGHGNQGHFISSLLKLFFSEYFTKTDLYRADNNKALLNAINNSMKSCFSDLNNVSNFANNAGFYSHANSFTSGANSTRSSSVKKTSSSNSINNYSYNNNNNNYNQSFNNNVYINNINNNNYNNNNYFKDSKEKSILHNIFYEKLTEENHALIKNSFQLAEASFAQSKYDMNFSGSTCICVFIIEDRIICGNCGDSRAILVASDKNITNANKIIFPLSVDHKPDLKNEANRIIKSNGRIEKRSENGIRTGPLRVWLKNENYPGLAMTRSIGDLVASKIGVTSEPEIIEFVIGSECKFVVVASDGVWEILSNEEVAAIVSPYYKNLDVESAAEKLVDEAAKKWRRVN